MGSGRVRGQDLGALQSVAKVIGADRYWRAGFTGKGVDVALIDSGVAPVKGLAASGKIVNGADLSFESQDEDLRYLDTFGHGTHLAGIIAGRDGAGGRVDPADDSRFLGIAPGARVVNVKVADAFGTTDVSQVLAAIGWVVEHRHDHGLDIRVLNLSFGTDGVQSYILDPLALAVEQAWRKGIFVVVSAGNEGYGSRKLDDPAYDPLIMAVGATSRSGTAGRADDRVADFSSVGDASRHPDVVVPGTSILSLRVPGSNIDRSYPGARVGDSPRLFRGTGTSQAAAVVSGAAALVIEQRPGITPDQLKKLFQRSAYELPRGNAGQSELREAGVRVALDDFGTGYSSLTRLRQMPVDEIKIDRSFVSQVEHDEHDRAIVRSVIRLAHDLGLTVVAEGVETRACWDWLVHEGCDEAQGFLMGRPMPASELEASLRMAVSAAA